MATTTSKQQVSIMIKHGFISDQSLPFSPSRTLPPPSPPSPPPPSPPPASPPPASSSSPSSSRTRTATRTTNGSVNRTTTTTHPSSSSSPPAPAMVTRSSPSLYEMMSAEQNHSRDLHHTAADTSRRKSHDRVMRILADSSFKNSNWGRIGGDVKLTVVSKDGFRVSMDVHRLVLVNRSQFFAEKLGRDRDRGVSHSVEICDCDDVEVYVETVVLMYCEDLRKKLIGENVLKVLGLLKVSAAVMFDDGITACLEYLEAVPWSNDEEEKVVSILQQLRLHCPINNVLKRLSVETSTSTRADDIFTGLLTNVLQAKDDKARREMKNMISGLLKEDGSDHNKMLDVSKDTLYHLSHRCLSSLVLSLSEATSLDDSKQDRGALMAEIAREADNIQWLVDILIEKKMAEDFVKLWADQTELATLHSKIPTIYRHEISRITAQLCIAIGRCRVLVPKETRFSLLTTWLDALYDDFGWMRRSSRSVDRKLVEDGLSHTILTLPLQQQQLIMLNWFDRYLSKGDDCPNIQKAFEVWWRRSFVRPQSAAPRRKSSELQVDVYDSPK